MKNKNSSHEGDYRSLLILEEISNNKELTQFELSKKIGVAVGLINSYIKNFVTKGYITVSTIPRRRYLYYVTPKGFMEKTRLTYQHLHNFTNLYRVARKDFGMFFKAVKENPALNHIVFCGVDEIAEIAYLSLKEVGLELGAVIDDAKAGKIFFTNKIIPIKDIGSINYDVIIITSFKEGKLMTGKLLGLGVSREKIFDISEGGWLKKIEAGAAKTPSRRRKPANYAGRHRSPRR